MGDAARVILRLSPSAQKCVNAGLNPAARIEAVPHWGCRLEAPRMDEPMGDVDLIPRQGVQLRRVSRVGMPRDSWWNRASQSGARSTWRPLYLASDELILVSAVSGCYAQGWE